MPKVVITESTLPIALHTLDKWTGKLTWASYGAKLAEVLGVSTISRHTLLNYDEITQAFNLKKEQLRESVEKGVEDSNVTIERLKDQKNTLEAKVRRLENQVNLYKEQFVRWQYNLHKMPGVDLEKLNDKIDTPLPPIKRSSE